MVHTCRVLTPDVCFTVVFMGFYSITQRKRPYTISNSPLWLHITILPLGVLFRPFAKVSSNFRFVALCTFITWLLHFAYRLQLPSVCEDVFTARLYILLASLPSGSTNPAYPSAFSRVGEILKLMEVLPGLLLGYLHVYIIITSNLVQKFCVGLQFFYVLFHETAA